MTKQHEPNLLAESDFLANPGYAGPDEYRCPICKGESGRIDDFRSGKVCEHLGTGYGCDGCMRNGVECKSELTWDGAQWLCPVCAHKCSRCGESGPLCDNEVRVCRECVEQEQVIFSHRIAAANDGCAWLERSRKGHGECAGCFSRAQLWERYQGGPYCAMCWSCHHAKCQPEPAVVRCEPFYQDVPRCSDDDDCDPFAPPVGIRCVASGTREGVAA